VMWLCCKAAANTNTRAYPLQTFLYFMTYYKSSPQRLFSVRHQYSPLSEATTKSFVQDPQNAKSGASRAPTLRRDNEARRLCSIQDILISIYFQSSVSHIQAKHLPFCVLSPILKLQNAIPGLMFHRRKHVASKDTFDFGEN